jgi:hypothetical protein
MPEIGPSRRSAPELARFRATTIPALSAAAQPILGSDRRWRARLIIWKPDHESWRMPIPLPPSIAALHDQIPVAAPPSAPARPFSWPKLIPQWRLVIRPARAAIAAVPLVGLWIALSAVSKTPMHEPHRASVIERVQTYIRNRSQVLIEDNFLSGISGWEGGPDWAAGWAYGASGFVQPRKLALLRASLPLADYRVELVGQIAQKSLSWVFRATDLNNYYAVSLTIAKPGPLPMAAISRYTVVDGVAMDRVELPLPLGIRNDTLYRIETSATEDRFTTSVNGQVVDTFFDRHHRSGGVGLFSAPGEDSRILSVRVVERDDFLGRMCAFFGGGVPNAKTASLPINTTKTAATEQ